MTKLKIKDIIAKKDSCLERNKIKTTFIHSKFLDGDLEFHSLDKGDMSDTRDRLKSNSEKGLLYFIYLSCDDLRNDELLKAFGCDKFENHRIVEVLFTEAERSKIIEILEGLNGLNNLNSDEIFEVLVEDVKNS